MEIHEIIGGGGGGWGGPDVALSNLRNTTVALSNLRNAPVACR